MVCRRHRLGLVGPNTITTTVAGQDGSVELQGLVTALSEVRCAVPSGDVQAQFIDLAPCRRAVRVQALDN